MMLIVFLPFSLFLCGECLWESHALSSPFPFPLCVPRLSSPCVSTHSHVLSCLPHVCVVVATHQHCALLCCFLSSLLFLCLSSTTITPLHPLCVKRVCVGNGKEDEQTCVIQKACGKRGEKKRNRRPHVVSTPCHQPWSQPCPHTLHFTLLTTSLAFLLLWSSLFLCCSFCLEDKRRMVCVMSNKHTKVALLFLCQPSFSNHLFLLVTSPHSCHCGVVMSVTCPIHATNETK